MKADWVDIVAPKAPAHIMVCMFNLYIDADACPVKEECYRVAKRYALPVLVVANCTMRIPVDPSVTMVVQTGFGAADDWIAEQIGPGDIAITVDVPLAARCVEKGALVITAKGFLYTDANIGGALALRNLNEELRQAGVLGAGGPAPMMPKDRSKFLATLDQAIQSVRKTFRKRL